MTHQKRRSQQAAVWLTACLLVLGATLTSIYRAAAQSNVYVVRPGDTLSNIAKTHGTDMGTLLRLNSLPDANVIRVGQPLTVPGRGAAPLRSSDTIPVTDRRITAPPMRVYVVTPGDTLSSLAVKFQTSLAQLAEINQRSPSARLFVGEALRVPVADSLRFIPQEGNDIPVPGKYYVHVLQQGESLGAVADQYGTSLRRLIDLNAIDEPGNVKPGLRVIVPPPSFAEIFKDIAPGPDGNPVYPVIPTQGKWISVDLDQQHMWAWEGDKMVNSFPISSGKSRTPTVTGVFRIWAKVAAQTMEGGSRAAGDYYNLPNVQWVQYFFRDYSFHGAYWHNNFGHPMSHGCVNMRNSDAKWLFDWASPTIEDYGWHTTNDEDPGTLVIVYQ